jgi:glycosyltransferase involved in cell wall biosynthesis
MTTLHAVVPDGLDDPARPSGGNTYDRRVLDGLRSAGWSVHEHAVPGEPLGAVLSGLPDGALLLVDGLVAAAASDVLVSTAARLRLVVLAHQPSGPSAVLAAASAVLTTSGWTRRRLLQLHGLCPERVHVAEPGVDAADLAPGTSSGGELLCVAAVLRPKGHDLLLGALAQVPEPPWRCTMAGSLDRDPVHVATLRRRAAGDGLDGRVTWAGPLVGDTLAEAYASADLLVLPTREESYGMVVTEALARGLPVLATAVGGVPEALGVLPDGRRPGILVPPDDAGALRDALRGWLTEPGLRSALRSGARVRRASLAGWETTTDHVARVLAGVAA